MKLEYLTMGYIRIILEFYVVLLLVMIKVMYQEWILSCCVPGIVIDSHRGSTKYETKRSFIVLRYSSLENSIFKEITDLYQQIAIVAKTRLCLNEYLPDQLSWLIIQYIDK